MKSHAPLIEAVIVTSQKLKNPTVKAVITRIAQTLHAAIMTKAECDVPPFVIAHLEDTNVAATLAARERARLVAGGAVISIRSWSEAWEWLLHAYAAIEQGRATSRGVDEILTVVFHYSNELNSLIDFEWVAINLNYGSIEEANQAVSLFQDSSAKSHSA